MEKGPIEVVTLDSASEDDDLQIVSENITNYGNYQTPGTPVEITTELQEKIRQSLEKISGMPGRVKAIQVFATKNNNGKGAVRASYNSANGQCTQVINVGPDSKANFVSKVQVVLKYDFGNKRKPAYPLATNSEKPKMAKYLPPPISNDPKLSRDGKPSSPSSPVILFSPIGKVKQSPIRKLRKDNRLKKKIHQNLQLQNMTPINQHVATPQKKENPPSRLSFILPKYNHSSRPYQNSLPSWQDLPLPPQISSISQLDQNLPTNLSKQKKMNAVAISPIKYASNDEEEYTNISASEKVNPVAFSLMKSYACDYEEGSTNVIETEKINPIKRSLVKYASDDEEGSTNIREIDEINPILFSPIKYASDDEEGSANVNGTGKLNSVVTKCINDDEEGCENSIIGVRSSPMSSLEELLNIFPKPKSEEKSTSKVKEVYCIDAMMEKQTKLNTEKKNIDHKDIISQIEQKLNKENEKELLDLDTKQDVNEMQHNKQWPDSEKEIEEIIKFGTNAKILMSLKVDIECLPKNMVFELSKQDETNKRKSGLKVNAEMEDSISNFNPLWTTIFPPSPPSPTPPEWYGSTHLWQLDATEFVSITGLCRNEAAAEMRRRVDAPKPLVRVLRPRPRKIDFGFGEDFVTE